MIVLNVDKNRLSIQQKELLISGSVNSCRVRFVFSEDWEGLTRTAVFKGSGETRSVLLDKNNECMIPWETLKKPAGMLEAGVCGTGETGTVLTTVLTNLGMILPGAVPGESTQPPTPDVYQQILAETQETREAAAKSCTEAAAAVSRAVQAAERAEAVSMNPPKLSEGGTWMVWSSDADSYVDTGLSAIGPEGKQGESGPQGAQGEKGDKGDAGERGPQGEQGETGQQGPQGVQGETGAVGPQGPRGIQGEQGPQGIQGEQGPQGPRGFPGTEVVIHETYGPLPVVTVDMAIPGTPLQPVSEIRLVQEGEGTPSPENVRNIVGWDQITLTHGSKAHDASFPETVYGGSYDWAKGELVSTYAHAKFIGASSENWQTWGVSSNMDGNTGFFIYAEGIDVGYSSLLLEMTGLSRMRVICSSQGVELMAALALE